jgi:hypothetical protein
MGGYAIRDAIRAGAREIDVAMAGRDAMELAIAERFADAEYRDSWVWFQSGPNTDGAHNPVTARVLQRGDILSLNTFPMISGYYTALERTLFVGGSNRTPRRAHLGGECRRPRAGPRPDPPRCDLFGDHRRAQRLSGRTRPAGVPQLRLWPFLRHPVALLRARGRAGTARGYRYGAANPAWSSRWSRC